MGRLVEIRWSVCISKSQSSLYLSFSRTDSGLCIYHLFVWSNFYFLHNFPWITFPTQSCLVLYSFWANLLLLSLLKMADNDERLIQNVHKSDLTSHNLWRVRTHILGNDQRRLEVHVLRLQHRRFRTTIKKLYLQLWHPTHEHKKANKN